MRVFNLNNIVTIEGVTFGSPTDYIAEINGDLISIYNSRLSLYEVFEENYTNVRDINNGSFSSALEVKGYLDSIFTSNSQIKITSSPAFADKAQFFFRGTGVKTICPAGQTTQIKITSAYPKAKFNGATIMYGQDGDVCNLKVLDSDTGTYTTVPNYLLNQFGFNWNITKEPMKEKLPYDADIFLGMQLVVEYTNNGSSDIEVGVNFYLHEDKS